MVGSMVIQLYGHGTFIILLALLIVTQIAVEVTHALVSFRDFNIFGSKLIQVYAQDTLIIFVGLLKVTLVEM